MQKSRVDVCTPKQNIQQASIISISFCIIVICDIIFSCIIVIFSSFVPLSYNASEGNIQQWCTEHLLYIPSCILIIISSCVVVILFFSANKDVIFTQYFHLYVSSYSHVIACHSYIVEVKFITSYYCSLQVPSRGINSHHSFTHFILF